LVAAVIAGACNWRSRWSTPSPAGSGKRWLAGEHAILIEEQKAKQAKFNVITQVIRMLGISV
jgi:hypothetical protein